MFLELWCSSKCGSLIILGAKAEEPPNMCSGRPTAWLTARVPAEKDSLCDTRTSSATFHTPEVTKQSWKLKWPGRKKHTEGRVWGRSRHGTCMFRWAWTLEPELKTRCSDKLDIHLFSITCYRCLVPEENVLFSTDILLWNRSRNLHRIIKITSRIWNRFHEIWWWLSFLPLNLHGHLFQF